MAILAAAIFNAAGATKGNTKKGFRAGDFLPLFEDKEPAKQDVNLTIKRLFGVPDGR